MKKYYLTSAIPYVNAAPHIGHAQEFVYTDTVARYQKLSGKSVAYLCGADENGLKIVQAAEKAHLSTQEFADQNQQEFLNLADKLNVHFDIWQRGSDRKHHFISAQKLWQLCTKNGDIYKKKYSGLYCVGCECFYQKSELDENEECLEHPGKKLEVVSEENYFFRLSRYQSFIEDLITSDRLKIIPQTRKKEALAFIKKGLEDISISRSRKRAKNWGVPVPADPNQIIYVWFDALNIYQSGIGFGWKDKKYHKWWPADLHVIGKGILRFHAVYWIAILKSAGLKLPKSLFVHGYLTVDGQKMSKTIGNVIDPIDFINKYGCDALRYYLLREIPSYGDGDFSQRRFKEIYNADLANGLGNTIARVAKLCHGLKFRPSIKTAINEDVKNEIEIYRFDHALEKVWLKIKKIDIYFDKKEPWKIKDKKILKQILQPAVDKISQIAYDLKPFLPQTSDIIFKQFNQSRIKSEKSLFPRI